MKQIKINGKIYYSILIMLWVLLSIVTAQDTATLPPVKQGDCFVVQETCSNCTYVTITSVKYPNQTLITLNYNMSSVGLTSWYNSSFCDSNMTGTYIFGTKGDPDNVVDSEFIRIDVNPTGIESTGERSTILITSIIVMLIVSILFFLAFMYYQHPSAKYSFLVMSVIFFLVTINLVLNSLQNELVDPTILALFNFISAASFYFYWLGGGLLCVILVLTVFTNMQDMVKRKKVEKYGGYD